MFNFIFDLLEGGPCIEISDNMAMDSEGDLLMRVSDNQALDLETGELHLTSSWGDEEDDW